MSSTFRPTHCITFTPENGEPRIDFVELYADEQGDGPAYMEDEASSAPAQTRWEVVGGEWLFQGSATPDGIPGTVTVQMTPRELFKRRLGSEGFDLGSKTSYVARFPKHRVMYNARVFVDGQQVWWGDLDLDDDATDAALRQLATELGRAFSVLPENDSRSVEFSPDGLARN